MTREPNAEPKTARSKQRGRKTLWSLGFLCLMGGAFVLAAIWAQGRTFVAPGWIRDRFEARLDAQAPDRDVAFGDIVVVLDQGWRPRASIRDVVVRTPDGIDIISVSDVRAGIDLSGLLEGRIAFSSLDLSGVFMTLRRDETGAVALIPGLGAGGEGRRARSLADLIGQIDEVLLRPGLQHLTRASLRALTLRYEDQLSGRAWTIDGGRIQLSRAANDLELSVDLALLGGGAQAATLQANYRGEIGARASEFGVTIAGLDASEIATESAAFAWLEALRAPLSGALRGGINDDGTFAPLNATFHIDKGVIQPTPEAAPIPIDGARSYFTYFPAEGLLRFDDLSIETQWGQGRLEGEAAIALSGRQVDNLVGQFRLSTLQINPANLYPALVALPDAELDFKLELKPFALKLGRLEIIDQGRRLNASGTLGADRNGWSIAVDAAMDGLDPARLLEFWPEAVKVKSRAWIAANVAEADLRDINAAVRIGSGGPPEVYLGFDYENADVRFLKEMPLITGARGHASLFSDRFVVVIDDGGVEAVEGGVVTLDGTSFIIPDVKAKESTPGVVRLIASSSATAALSMLDQNPLRVMQKAALPVDLAQGAIAIAGTIALPLKKGVQTDQVEFNATGTLSDVRTEVLIRDRVLTAPRLEITASDKLVEIAGPGALDGVAFDAGWRLPLGQPPEAARSSVTGDLEISQKALDAFNIALPPGSVQGAAIGSFTVDLVKGQPPKLALRSDLRGARVSLAPVGWSKPADTGATLEVDATLGDIPSVSRLVLDAPGLSAQGSVGLTADKTLDFVRIDRLQVGNWLDAPVDLLGQGRGAPVAVALRGGTLDLRRAQFGGAGGSEAVPISVALDRLQVTDAIAITALRGSFDTGGGFSGEFQGAVNGTAPVVGRVRPQGGRSAIDLTANDAGAVVEAAGIFRQARGGQMSLTLNPVGEGGAFDGKLRITDTKIVDAPSTAALLNAISIVGLVNELNGDGIFFSEVEADFRLSPARITLREASAVGASMGLSMDGVFATDTGQIAMQGVISPVYLVNAIGSVFTRKGEGLFGFNYTLTGPASAPKVSVNPLSALAPSGLRDIFRGPRPDVPLVEGEIRAPEPVRKPPVAIRGEDR